MPNPCQFWILDFGFWISKSKIENRKSKISSTAGQAMVELTIAVVAIMALAAGMLLLNRIEWARLSALVAARGNAGALAMAKDYTGVPDPQFISDWQAGPDEKRYTPDDQAIPDLNAVPLVRGIVYDAGGLSIIPDNALYNLGSAAEPLDQFYLVKGRESVSVDLSDIPAVSSLLTKEPTLTMQEKAWLTWTEGIY